MKPTFSYKYVSLNFAFVILATTLVFSGCAHESKNPEGDEPMQLETDPQAQAQAQTQAQTADQTTTKDAPAPDPNVVAPAKNSLPDSSYFNTEEKNAVASSATESSEDESATHDEGPSPKVPAVQPMAHKGIHNTEKQLKKVVKFKLSKKSSAQVALSEQGQDVKMVFTANKVKSGKYWLFLEKSCKKSNKGKPQKVAQFVVKKGDKFSGKASTHAFTLKPGTVKSLKGKALVLYLGPKANARLICETIK